MPLAMATLQSTFKQQLGGLLFLRNAKGTS